MIDSNLSDRCEKLTEPQKECLRLVAALMSSKEIARQLHISHHTVDQRLKRAQHILGVSTRAEAARILMIYEDREGDSGALYNKLVYGNSELPPTRYSRKLKGSATEPSPEADSGGSHLPEGQSRNTEDAQPASIPTAPLSALFDAHRENGLSKLYRVAIILVIVVVSLVAFALLINAVEVLSRLT